MAVKEISNEKLTNEEKDVRGKIWATNDDRVTYWFESLDDVLPWMAEHDRNSYEAIKERMAARGIQQLGQ
jgi:hypothetical protein